MTLVKYGSDAQKFVYDVFNFMASQGSQILNTMELIGMEKIRDKLKIWCCTVNTNVNKTM